MPQFDPEFWLPQLVWLTITFVLLYLLLARLALPRIANILEERQDRIANDLDTAERLKRESDEAMEAYETALADARTRAHGIALDNRQRVQAEMDDERSRLLGELAIEAEAAEARIAETKAEAMATVPEIAIQTTQEIVRALTGIEIDDSEADTAVRRELGSAEA